MPGGTFNQQVLNAAGITPTGAARIQFAAACGSLPDPFRADRGYGTITSLEPQANSSYNSLQISVVFNHTQWTGVNSGASCFGDNFNAGTADCMANNNSLRPGGAHNPRILQLGMKFLF